MLVIEVIDKYTVHVIHYSSPCGPESKHLSGNNIILEEEINFDDVQIELISYRDDVCLYERAEAIQRAQSRLTEKDYSIFCNNCESFVNWSLTGEDITDQGKAAILGTVVVGAAVGAAVMGAVAYGIGSISGSKNERKKKK